MTQINQQFVDELYNPNLTGLKIIHGSIPLARITTINDFIEKNQSSFQEKREKYIQNNQMVALLYRGKFDKEALNKTIFSEILDDYLKIREQLNQYSKIPFEKGTSIEIKLIYYPISPLGVGIHKDLSSNINAVIFFNLKGSTNVKTYATKQGNNPVDHFITTGDISIMRAPRFKAEPDIRPYHGVEEVFETRTVLVIREIDEELEMITNKDNWRGF